MTETYAKNLLHKGVMECLEEAERLGDIETLAIPVLGSGLFGFDK